MSTHRFAEAAEKVHLGRQARRVLELRRRRPSSAGVLTTAGSPAPRSDHAKAEVEQMSQQTSAAPATAADVMQPPLTTVEQQAHVAAAAYLMKHAGASALLVLDAQNDQPAGIITEADIAHAVADGKDVNSVRIYELMTTRPTIIKTTTNIRDAAKIMTSGHFRHLPVVGDTGLSGILDIADVCRALLETDASPLPAGMAEARWPGI
jgi:CBS domain-containing protein